MLSIIITSIKPLKEEPSRPLKLLAVEVQVRPAWALRGLQGFGVWSFKVCRVWGV